jgi:hypothetical protein
MKGIFILILCLIANHLFAQNIVIPENYNSNKSFEQTLGEFINASKERSPEISKYFIYSAYISLSSNDCKDTSISLGYIVNEASLQYVGANYFYIYKGDYVLFRLSEDYFSNRIEDFVLCKIDSVVYNDISKKLFSLKEGEIGGIYGTTESIIYTMRNNQSKIEFFDDSDNMPNDKHFRKYFPRGGVIEKIK